MDGSDCDADGSDCAVDDIIFDADGIIRGVERFWCDWVGFICALFEFVSD